MTANNDMSGFPTAIFPPQKIPGYIAPRASLKPI